jgi:hypothetical protein
MFGGRTPEPWVNNAAQRELRKQQPQREAWGGHRRRRFTARIAEKRLPRSGGHGWGAVITQAQLAATAQVHGGPLVTLAGYQKRRAVTSGCGVAVRIFHIKINMLKTISARRK